MPGEVIRGPKAGGDTEKQTELGSKEERGGVCSNRVRQEGQRSGCVAPRAKRGLRAGSASSLMPRELMHGYPRMENPGRMAEWFALM